MNRKQFIESHGGTCRNWTWSWSFVNHDQRFVIFGAWDRHTEGNTSLILSDDWRISGKGRKQPAYDQSLEHARLVDEEGYALYIFPMTYSPANKGDVGGPARIDGFVPELFRRSLIRVEGNWYASDDMTISRLPEEVDEQELFVEGAARQVTINGFERSAAARKVCLEHHGYRCIVCGFDFEAVYGEIGKHFIHVHHVVPLSDVGEEYQLDPQKDLVPICPNCHAIVHRTRPALSIDKLRRHIVANKAHRAGRK